MKFPSTYVYIDGFNLYRRALESSDYKWLDLDKLCAARLPNFDVKKIYYFTANIKPLPHDPQQAQRQQTYFRALETNPKLTLIKSTFRDESAWMPAQPWEYDELGQPKLHKVRRMKEKGSDVNLATQLLIDAYENKCEAQFVLTADSDLVSPISHIKNSLGRSIGVILPTERNSKNLKKIAEPLVYHLRKGLLESSQYPDILTDKNGEFTKPDLWGKTEIPTEVGISRPAAEATGDVRKE